MTAADAAAAAKCPLCGSEEARIERQPGRDAYDVACPVCDRYSFRPGVEEALRSGAHDADRELLSGLARQAYEAGGRLELRADNLEQLVRSASLPRNPLDAVELLLLYLGDRQKSFSEYVTIRPHRFPVAVARSVKDFGYVADLLLELGFAELWDDAFRDQFRLTAAGWRRLEELRATRPDSRQAFVAMWFAEEMAPAWREGFRPALEDTGYRPVRIDVVQHNEQIDDRIVAEIRRSGLVVADFTGGRGGVYFEAGFAMGLGIPVIWTCRADHIQHVHFDTRQYNHILWERPGDLREKLRLRIEATLPRRPRLSTLHAPPEPGG